MNTNSMTNTPIGLISNSWNLGTLDELVEILDHKRVPLSEEERNKISGKYPYCGANGIIDFISEYLFDGEYVLLAEDGGHWNRFDQSAYVMIGKFWVNNHAHILLANKGLANTHFLKYILNYLELSRYISGSTRGKLNQKELRSIKLPIPPYVEQQGIAEVLGSVDETLRIQKQVIEKTELLRRGLMHQFLTEGIGHKEYKETSVGRIPRKWKCVSFGDIIREGPQNGVYKHSSLYGSGTHILRISDFNKGSITNSELNRVELAKDEVDLYKLEKNDIVINRVNSLPFLGKSAIISDSDSGAVFESNIMRLKVDQRLILPKYAISLLNIHNIKSQLWRKAKRAVAQASINQQDVNGIKIPLPPIEEQKHIVKVIDNQDNIISKEKKIKSSLEFIKKGLMQVLLSGEVRVELYNQELHKISSHLI